MRPLLVLVLTSLLFKTTTGVTQQQNAGPQPKSANQETQDKLRTPLKRAAAAGRVDEVRHLLKTGVDVDEKDALGITALMVAVGMGHIDVVDVLLKAGADPNAAGGIAHVGFLSVMIMAMIPRNTRLELLDMLIAAGGKVNPPRPIPFSPLMSAVQQKDVDLIKALLARGADVNWADQIGTTALQDAIMTREPDVEVVKQLLRAGADPNKSRLWMGDFCISLLQLLDERLNTSNNKTNREIRDLLKRAGGKKYKAKSHRPCYE